MVRVVPARVCLIALPPTETSGTALPTGKVCQVDCMGCRRAAVAGAGKELAGYEQPNVVKKPDFPGTAGIVPDFKAVG